MGKEGIVSECQSEARLNYNAFSTVFFTFGGNSNFHLLQKGIPHYYSAKSRNHCKTM